jgi:cytochrome b involved in lipid metabolism
MAEEKSEEEKKVTMEQLGEHKGSGDLWLLVDGQGEFIV